jgi:hypothetical protein
MPRFARFKGSPRNIYLKLHQNGMTAMAIKKVESCVESKQITIEDELKGISFPALIHYPTLEPPAI